MPPRPPPLPHIVAAKVSFVGVSLAAGRIAAFDVGMCRIGSCAIRQLNPSGHLTRATSVATIWRIEGWFAEASISCAPAENCRTSTIASATTMSFRWCVLRLEGC